MHDKGKLATYIDITKQTILICWIALFSFWAIKLFGGNFFEILVENENFVKFSQLVQNTWLKHLVSLFTITLVNYFRFCCICEKFIIKDKKLIFVLIADITMWICSNFISSDFIQMFYGYIFIIIFGICVQNKYKKFYGVICVGLEFVFSSISMVIRNIPLEVSEDYIISLILSIDVYLMYLLYYLHINLSRIKKEI